jgi:hypothetical protein
VAQGGQPAVALPANHRQGGEGGAQEAPGEPASWAGSVGWGGRVLVGPPSRALVALPNSMLERSLSHYDPASLLHLSIPGPPCATQTASSPSTSSWRPARTASSSPTARCAPPPTACSA